MLEQVIKAILFDMDGTLTNTEPLGIKTLRHICEKLEIQLTRDEWELFDKVWRRDGTDIEFEEFMNQILTKYAPSTNSREVIEKYFTAYEDEIVRADLLPGVQELLTSIKGRYKLAVVTASTQSQAQAILKEHRWEEVFDAVVSQDEYKIKKPDPASFLLAAEKLCVEPSECTVIEDSKNGSQSGKNAGMYVIGVRAGNKHPQDLAAADEVVETMRELVGRL